MAKEIFISYSRKDYEKVREIKNSIDNELDIDCWMDLDGIESDAQFVNVIVSAINSHEVILFMMSASSMISKWTRDELALAERNKKRIVLMDIDHSRMPDDFFLLYNSKEQIEWSNALQRTKLFNDLRRWLNGNQRTPNILPINTVKEVIDMGERHECVEFVSEDDRLRFVKSLREYAVQGYTWAQRHLGLVYWSYDDNSPEFNEAEEWVRKAAMRGDSIAQYELGHYYWTRGDLEDAKKWCSMAAAQGHVAARNRLKTL